MVRRVADGVHRDLKTACHRARDDRVEPLCGHQPEAGLRRFVGVGTPQARTAGAERAVFHDLDGAQGEGAAEQPGDRAVCEHGAQGGIGGRGHRVHAHRQRLRRAQPLVRDDVGDLDSGVVHPGVSPTGVLRHRALERTHAIIHRKRRQRAAHDVHGVVHEDTTRVAGRIAHDAPAGWIGRGSRHPGTAHRHRVHPDRVAVNALEDHGMPGTHPVQLRRGRVFGRRPERLVPAPSTQPRADRRARGRGRHAGEYRRFRPPSQIERAEHRAEPRDMHVRIHESRQSDSGQRNAARGGADHREDVGFASDRDNAPIAHGHGLGARIERVERDEVSGEQLHSAHTRGGGRLRAQRPAEQAGSDHDGGNRQVPHEHGSARAGGGGHPVKMRRDPRGRTGGRGPKLLSQGPVPRSS